MVISLKDPWVIAGQPGLMRLTGYPACRNPSTRTLGGV